MSYSALFKATFAKVAVKVDVVIEQGADAILMSQKSLKNILTKLPLTEAVRLDNG